MGRGEDNGGRELRVSEMGCLEETDTCTGGHRQVGSGKAVKKR